MQLLFWLRIKGSEIAFVWLQFSSRVHAAFSQGY